MKMLNDKNQKNKETHFKKNCFFTIDDKTIYFNEIVESKKLKEIYSAEKPVITINCKINTHSIRPFLNISALECKKANIKPKNILILRISKGKKSYEIISKIGLWGKIYVPQKVIKKLSINHHERTLIEIIKNRENIEEGKEVIVIANLFKDDKDISVIKRAKNFVTVYKTGFLPITLPNNIKLSPKLIEAFFLIHGDGHYKSKLFFVNNNPGLHNLVIDTFLEEIKIPRTLWRGRINLNVSHNQNFAINYWINQVKIMEEQLYPNISKTKFNTSLQGNLRIVIDYLIVAEVFRKIFDFMKENLNKELNFHALNGLLAAEGGAQINNKSLHRITLSYNKEEKLLFTNVLKKCNIFHLFKDRDEGKKGTFIVEKWENLYLFFDKFLSQGIILFKSHDKRKNYAFKGMTNHSFTQTMNKYLSKLTKQSSFTIKELSKALNIREDSCLSTIRKNQYTKFINMQGAGINRKPFIISLSKQGKDLLNIISMIKQEVKS